MISLKQKSEGFTLVELLIVIVVIAILATLVIVTFTGIQQKARDSVRQTDIDALDEHLEAYYAENGYYPTLNDLDSSSWVATNMKGLDYSATQSPEGDNIAGTAGAGGSAGWAYGYTTTGCEAGTPSSTANECTSFILTANLEAGGTFTKSSNTQGSGS
jgi:prepilin-type N-terminal cleavage/methylation domain-containing protein